MTNLKRVATISIIIFALTLGVTACTANNKMVDSFGANERRQDDESRTNYIANGDRNNTKSEENKQIVDWSEHLNFKWRFKGALPYQYLVGGTNNTLLVLGDDGGLSGYHEDSMLYGINRRTGEQQWSVYGESSPMSFFIDEEEATITVSTSIDKSPSVKKIALDSGKILWEKHPESWNNYSGIKIAGTDDAVLVNLYKYSNQQLIGKLVALNELNGIVLWERGLEPGERLLNIQRPLKWAVVAGPKAIKALDFVTGKVIWRFQTNMETANFRDGFDRTMVVADPRIWGKQQANHYWFSTKDQFVLLDLDTGKVLDKIKNNRDQRIIVVNEDYIMIHHIRGSSSQPDIHSILYSLKTHKEVWESPWDIKAALFEDNSLYYLTGDRATKVNLANGKELWSIPYATEFFKQPILVDSELIIPGKEVMTVLDSKTGNYLYQVKDLSVEDVEGRFLLNYYAMLTKLGDEIYVGGANGLVKLTI